MLGHLLLVVVLSQVVYGARAVVIVWAISKWAPDRAVRVRLGALRHVEVDAPHRGEEPSEDQRPT